MSKNRNKNSLQKNYKNNTNKQDGTIDNIALSKFDVPVYKQKNTPLDNFFEKKIKKNVDTKKNINYIIKDGGSYTPLGNSLYRGTQSPAFTKEKSECQKRSERKQVLFAINKHGKNSGNYKKTRSKIGC